MADGQVSTRPAAKPQQAVNAPLVYSAIANVMAELAVAGIGKDRKNDQQGYKFRGVDDVYNALAPLLATASLIIVPKVLSRQCEARATAKGGVMYDVTCQVEFTLTSAIDGSSITATTFGEAMDAGDKATNKAMSAAYKYMAFQTFCIPTEGDNDADAHTPPETDEFITTEQLADLRKLADEVGADLEKFCAYAKIDALSDLRQSDLPNARKALEAKRKAVTK